MPMPKVKLTLEQRSNDDRKWIRSNKPNSKKEDESTLVSLSNLAGITILRAKPSIEDLSKTMEDAIDWLCKNIPSMTSTKRHWLLLSQTSVKCHCR